ncbi:MAG TPA: hypothetical protein VGN97_03855 [Mesorhizobium sp.]|jgi:hypothetical protein|nr:hypothetical protein [Mesorhizobium sp.]
MTPNFAVARQHIENARDVLRGDDPKAQRMCEVLDLTIEALTMAERQARRQETVVIRGLFKKASS